MTIDLCPRVERSFGNPKMMQKPRNSARMNTELAPNAVPKIDTEIQDERPAFLRHQMPVSGL